MATKKVNELKSEINRLQAEVYCIENGIEDSNTIKLVAEVSNLIDGVGEGYIEGDYFAPSRYYSEMQGVKNIRMGEEGVVEVKITSPAGLLLPKEVVIKGVALRVIIFRSSKYEDEVDY